MMAMHCTPLQRYGMQECQWCFNTNFVHRADTTSPCLVVPCTCYPLPYHLWYHRDTLSDPYSVAMLCNLLFYLQS